MIDFLNQRSMGAPLAMSPVGNAQMSPTFNFAKPATDFASTASLNQINTAPAMNSSMFRDFINPAVSVGLGVANTLLGYQQVNQAEDMFNFKKDAFNKQFAIQKEELDYQRKRRADKTAAHQEYMANFNKGRT